MEIEKERKNFTLNSGIRIKGILVVLLRAAALISRIAEKVLFFEGTMPAIDGNV